MKKELSHPQTREKIKRICQSPFFQLLLNLAREKIGKEREDFIDEIRKRLNLSMYWQGIIRSLIENPKADFSKILGRAFENMTFKDKVTGQDFFCVLIYPETTHRDLIDIHSRITKIYEEQKYKKRLRTSRRYELEMLALDLRRKGWRYDDIAKKLSEETGKEIDKYGVSDYIRRGRKKLSDLGFSF